MTAIATAVIGSAVVGGVASYVSGKRASESAEKGAEAAAAATTAGTAAQLDEIKRQWDYQQRILLPQIQEQYNAQRAYSDLLGIGGPTTAAPGAGQFAPAAGAPGTVGAPGAAGALPPAAQANAAEIADLQEQLKFQEFATTAGSGGAGTMRRRADARQQADYLRGRIAELQGGGGPGGGAGGDMPLPVMGAPGTSGVGAFRGPEGFRDPNLNPALLQEGAAGTGVYGDVFTESPGYSFAREEMERASDRVRSAGGNFGGRAVMEAQRRAKGLADQEYYNWAAGRTQDLTRLAGAEATDLGRQDEGYYNYLNSIARQAGFGGGPAGTAVSAAGQAGAQAAGAQGAAGARLAGIAGDLGVSQANIDYQQGAGINNALQAGMSNYLTAGFAGANIPGFRKPPPPQPVISV